VTTATGARSVAECVVVEAELRVPPGAVVVFEGGVPVADLAGELEAVPEQPVMTTARSAMSSTFMPYLPLGR
jgi:hypothetical protein